MKEIIFEVTEEDVDAGFSASALGWANQHTGLSSVDPILSKNREVMKSKTQTGDRRGRSPKENKAV